MANPKYRQLAAVAAVTVGAAYGAYRGIVRVRDTVELREYAVETRELGESICEQGWLVSLETEPVELEMTGEIVEIAPEGTRVKEGQVVVRLDDTVARDRLAEVEFNTHDAEQSKASGEAQYEYVRLVESNRLTELRARLGHARLAEADARAGLKPEDRRLLEIEREIAKLDLADAKDAEERQRRLFDKGFISRIMLEPYERRVMALEASLQEIDARIRLEEKGVPPETLLELRRNVEHIEAMLARGRKASERRLEYVQRQIDVAQANLEENYHDREQVDDDLASTEVKAPRDGILSVRNYYERQVGGWSEYKPGVSVRKHDLVADVINPGHVKVELMIHEADVDRFEVGTPARIRLPAFPGKVFAGKLIELGGVGRDRSDVAPRGFESGMAGVTMFNAAASVAGNGIEFRPGMSALVELVVEPPRPFLVVSRAAVRKNGNGENGVSIRNGDDVEEVTIQGRVFNEEFFLIESGLKAGDTVVVRRKDGSG